MASDTKEQILDAAERLIADKGIDGVSLRAITTAASVNLAAVHYHFGSKEALVARVFARRIEPVNRERLRLLDEFEERAGNAPLPLEDVVYALIAPLVHLYGRHEQGRLFMRLCGRIYAEQAPYLEDFFQVQFAELVRRIGKAAERAMPEAAAADRAWGLHFTVGSMVHTILESEKIRRFSGGMCDTRQSDVVTDRLVRFCTAGLRELSARPMSANSTVASAVDTSLEASA